MVNSFPIHFLLSSFILALLIIGIMLVKKVFKNHISIKTQYNIWFIFIIMLIIPFLPINTLHIKNLYNWMINISQSSDAAIPLSTIDSSLNNVAANSNWLQDLTLSVNRATHIQLNTILLGIWIAGMVCAIIVMIIGRLRVLGIRKKIKPIQDTDYIMIFDHCKEKLGVHRKITFGCSDLIEAPISFGLFRPCVVFPSAVMSTLTKDDFRYILLHELQHYKHKDILVNHIMCIYQIIYWFHPLVWYALKEMRLDLEIACDNSVINIIGKNNCIAYGNTIINFADKMMRVSSLTSIVEIGGTKKQIKKRIINIASYHSESFGTKVKSVAILILVGAIACGSTPLLAAGATNSQTYDFQDNNTRYEDLNSYFQGYDGSFVLYDTNEDQYYIYNETQSKQRISPDSTYKIYNSLFALETGEITTTNSSLPWDGTSYPFEAWNKDQDLDSAMEASVNWYFKELDRKTGLDRIEMYLNDINYGNHDVSGGLLEYWAESSLLISPIEQVELLRAFYTNDFHFQDANIQKVKDAILVSESDGALLSGKTGTGSVNNKNINGWFIGYVEKDGNTYFFATNIQDGDNCKGTSAANITLNILNDKNIYTSN